MKFRIAAILAATLLLGAQAKPERSFQECPECPQMVGIPAGKFLMGSPAHEPGRFDSEGPQHVVTLKAFALAKYPVTSAEYLTFLNVTGYQPQPCNPLLGLGWRQLHRGQAATPTDVEPPRWPAVCLDWKDAEAFIAWINARARVAHPEIGNRNPYRLPSEAEWEYAARAGTRTARWWGDRPQDACANANVTDRQTTEQFRWPLTAQDTHNCDDGAIYTAEGGRYQANDFALRDMLGNVWQWVEDCWNPSYAGRPADQRAWLAGDCSQHVVRGGSWISNAWAVRSGSRSRIPAQERYFFAGLRVARAIAP